MMTLIMLGVGLIPVVFFIIKVLWSIRQKRKNAPQKPGDEKIRTLPFQDQKPGWKPGSRIRRWFRGNQ